MGNLEKGLAILAVVDFVGAVIAGFMGAQTASIVMLGLLVFGWLLWLTKEAFDLKAKFTAKENEINKTKEELRAAYAGRKSEFMTKDISISIIQPKDWKNKDPKRKRKTEYRIPVPVRGIASGPIGSAFLAYHVAPSGDYRVIEKLSISPDGAWSATIKIASHDNNPEYEVVAIALPSKIDLNTYERISIVDNMVLSNRIPVIVAYEETAKA